MTPPWPRRLSFLSVFTVLSLAAVFFLRAPWPQEDFSDLRDAVSDHRHRALLGAGHSSLSCASCHFAHPAKAPRPLWQKEGRIDSALFARESELAGGAKTSLCLSCHDGTVAPSLQAHGGSLGGDRFAVLGSNPSANHPVGVDYMAVLRRDPGSYNDPAMNARIVLEEGRVGCLSCHASHDLSSVSAGNVRREVCIDCHRR